MNYYVEETKRPVFIARFKYTKRDKPGFQSFLIKNFEVEEYLERGINFYDFPRGGKLAILNRVFPETKGEILVLTDASAMFVNDALQKLVRYFINTDVGVVSGVEKISAKDSFISKNEKAYWNYETKIKEWESKIYSTVGTPRPRGWGVSSLTPSWGTAS